MGMVVLDLRKAFDTVDHDILLAKLNAMGVKSIDWFSSYLKNRQQIVKIDCTHSDPLFMSHGVPQGSILGPLLYLCYVNDMSTSVSCDLLLYANDSALIVSGKYPYAIAQSLSMELNTCSQWLVDNRLSLHLGKTEAMLLGSKKK